MKKAVGLFIILVSLISCQQASVSLPEAEKSNVFIRNATWDKVQEFSVSARSIDSLDGVQEIVDTHNETATTDPWYVDTENTPIELAPTAEFYIYFTDTNEISYQITVERARVESERAWVTLCLQDYAQQFLRPVAFCIDTEVPEYRAPYIEPVYDPYVRWSFYAIAADGSIVWEEHITENPNYWNPDGSINEENCAIRMNALVPNWTQFEGAVRYIAGSLYTVPVPEIELIE